MFFEVRKRHGRNQLLERGSSAQNSRFLKEQPGHSALTNRTRNHVDIANTCRIFDLDGRPVARLRGSAA